MKFIGDIGILWIIDGTQQLTRKPHLLSSKDQASQQLHQNLQNRVGEHWNFVRFWSKHNSQVANAMLQKFVKQSGARSDQSGWSALHRPISKVERFMRSILLGKVKLESIMQFGDVWQRPNVCINDELELMARHFRSKRGAVDTGDKIRKAVKHGIRFGKILCCIGTIQQIIGQFHLLSSITKIWACCGSF